MAAGADVVVVGAEAGTKREGGAADSAGATDEADAEEVLGVVVVVAEAVEVDAEAEVEVEAEAEEDVAVVGTTHNKRRSNRVRSRALRTGNRHLYSDPLPYTLTLPSADASLGLQWLTHTSQLITYCKTV